MNPIELIGKSFEEAQQVFFGAGTFFTDEMIPDDIYLEIPQSGICLIGSNAGLIEQVQLFGQGKHDSYKEFVGEIYGGINFSDSRSSVRGKLGTPIRSNLGGVDPVLREHINPWDVYAESIFEIHFEYTEDAKRILLITIRLIY